MVHDFPYSGYLLAVAIGICLTAGWSVALLSAELSRERSVAGLDWRRVTLILSAGLGVWATHFSAMLGYRPDLSLSYAVGPTILSALISIALVGVPLTAVTACMKRRWRVIFAAMAGVGIWCMHAVGMSAMTHSHHAFSFATNAAGGLLGTISLMLWQARDHWQRPRLAGCLCFSGAVCAVHFVSLSGDAVSGHLTPLHAGVLSPGLMAACTAFAVSIACLASLLTFAQIRSRREREARALKAVIESMSDGLVFIDRAGKLRHFNRRFLHLFDTPGDQLHPGMTVDQFLDVVARHRGWNDDKRSLVGDAMKRWATATDGFDRECAMEDGRTYLMQGRAVLEQGVVLTFNDVTVERQAMEDLTYLAHHDALTGLGNRRALEEQMSSILASGQEFSLLLIDMDDFKQVNDTFGHGIGDKLLVHCASVLRLSGRQDSYIARMGGTRSRFSRPRVSTARWKSLILLSNNYRSQ